MKNFHIANKPHFGRLGKTGPAVFAVFYARPPLRSSTRIKLVIKTKPPEAPHC
jgi:hypothetical protein